VTERLLTNLPSLQSIGNIETGSRDLSLSNTNFKLISPPQGREVSNDQSISNSELASFQRYIGLGISKNDSPSSYKQILPKGRFVEANKAFSLLDSNEKNYFITLLGSFDNKNPKSPSDFLAISTLFSVLAYGNDFAKHFINHANEVLPFLDRSQEFLEAKRNLNKII
jgi:hypothetical protein